MPPPCSGIFGDVPCPGPFTDGIEELYFEGLTAGCQASPLLYCPAHAVSRAQMAVFLSPRTVNVLYPGCEQGICGFLGVHVTSCTNFSPISILVHVGDTVEWLGGGGGGQPPHTTTSGQCSPFPTSCTPDGHWDLSPPGASYTFTQPGTFPYYCSVGYLGVVSEEGGLCQVGTIHETGTIVVDP